MKRKGSVILSTFVECVKTNAATWNVNSKMNDGFPSAEAVGVVSSENLVPIHTKGSLHNRLKAYKRLSYVLLILFILLLLSLIILTCFYVNAKHSPKICNSEECLRSAANLRLSMNPEADPCEDFYDFTCGRWTDEHPNHGWFPKFSSFETISEHIAISTLKFLEDVPEDDEPLPVKQTRMFYESCLDLVARDEKGYEPIFRYLKEAEVGFLPQMLNVSRKVGDEIDFDWIKADVNLKRVFSMDVFVGFLVDPDMYNRSTYAMYIGSPAQFCPLPSPIRRKNSKNKVYKPLVDVYENFTDDGYDDLKKEAHKRVFKQVIKSIYKNQIAIPSDEKLDEAYEVVYNITEETNDMIDEISSDPDDYLAQTITTTQLQNATDDYLKEKGEIPYPIWNRYLSLMFEGINVTLKLDGNDELLIDPEELTYLQKMVHFLTVTPKIQLELYVWWITVYAMIINTTPDIQEYIEKQAAPFRSQEVVRSRSLDCASLVTNFMGMAISYGIADRTFENTTKPKVQEMLGEIKVAFTSKVNRLKWMDKQTKALTLEKTKYMASFIGFPEWLFKPNALEIYYEGLEMKSDTFLENMMEMVKSYTPYRLELLNEENVRAWTTDPTTVNAYNSFTDNSIMVPMAVLTYPVYHLGLEVLNYGAIGSILGHELTHGFDNTGRKYDKYGSYNEWWSKETIESFENLTTCFVNQYNNFTVPTVEGHVKGRRTLGENLADNGGIHHAYLAYKNYLKKHGSEPFLPGFEHFTSDQLFFISFGNIWCETTDSESLKYQLATDEHCPSQIRVLGTLQNTEEFASAFKCPLGSKMNPNRTRCKIW